MRWISCLTWSLLGCALLMTSCKKFDFWRRESACGVSRPEVLAHRFASTAPDIEGEDFDGTPFKLSDYRGKVVLLSFWAST